jgi:5-methylcytosine-specific restriction endonuclease McrA
LLALVGATGDDYVLGLEEFLNQHSYVWTGWTYRILPRDEKYLKDQEEKHGCFHLYLHYSKHRLGSNNQRGSGNIEAVAVVREWISSPNEVKSPEPQFTVEGETGDYKAKAWLQITKIIRPEDFIVTRSLTDYYDDKKRLNPSTLQSRFAPVIDVFDPLPSEPMTDEEFNLKEEQAEKRAQQRSDKELEERAKQAKGRPARAVVTGSRCMRNLDVAEYAKRRAKGKCQLCEIEAPFRDKQSTPYLEVHHIVWLSKGGEDTTENTVALCPNCHRKMHVLNLPRDTSRLLSKVTL